MAAQDEAHTTSADRACVSVAETFIIGVGAEIQARIALGDVPWAGRVEERVRDSAHHLAVFRSDRNDGGRDKTSNSGQRANDGEELHAGIDYCKCWLVVWDLIMIKKLMLLKSGGL